MAEEKKDLRGEAQKLLDEKLEEYKKKEIAELLNKINIYKAKIDEAEKKIKEFESDRMCFTEEGMRLNF